MASTTDRPVDCTLQQAADGVAVIHPERFCFGSGARGRDVRAHVLVVDRHAYLAALTAGMLVELGYDARWCVDADDAFERLDRGDPVDLLFVPDGDGQLAGNALARRPGLRVIFTHGSEHRGLAALGDRLAKPFTRARLHRKVDQVLARPPASHTELPTA